MNIVDLIIIIFLIYFLVMGYLRGFIRQLFDLVVLVIAFVLAFSLYQPLGSFITGHSSIEMSFGKVLAFFLIWFVIELTSYIVYVLFYEKIPENIRISKYNHFLGFLPAIARAYISLWVIFGLLSLLPVPIPYREMIANSFFAKPLTSSSKTIEKYVGNVFGGAIDETVNFLTIKPESDENISLGYKTTSVSIDELSEEKMLALVNEERAKKGKKPLVMDNKLREVARAHSKDMFAKGYFAHKNMEGLSPFQRMDLAGVQYLIAGENLALAPDVDTAHKGLINSPGHYANIMTTDFRKVGIGVIDGGKYGKMFSQEFTD